MLQDIPAEDTNELYDRLKKVITATSEEILGHCKKQRKKLISETIWQKVEKRHKATDFGSWTRLGHILRKNKGRHHFETLSWASLGKRIRGRPFGTWRRTIEEEMKVAGKT